LKTSSSAVVLDVEIISHESGALRVVSGRHAAASAQSHADNITTSPPALQSDLDQATASGAVYAVFTRDAVSRCNVELGARLAIHPPW